MFNFSKKEEFNNEEIFKRNLISELERIYEINANYGLSGNAYLPGNNEVEIMINKILELKNSQIREEFLLNSDTIEFVTQMDYVKDMVDNITIQKESVYRVTAGSQEMSSAIEEIANDVQASLITTNEAVSISTDSLAIINESFKYINKSFEEVNVVQDKMHNVVEVTKEIDKVVNIINEVSEQTNLLALNASIEAARAGELGTGFAIVANEIKKLANNTKESANFIRDMVKRLRSELSVSENSINEAVTVFSKGKEHINKAVTSMDKMEGHLEGISSAFENISANIEEQSAITQEITSRLSEINSQTQTLSEVCMKTGQGIYNISIMAENLRNTALPYFKDFKGNQMLKPVAAEHLLWKWKAYNAVCGFVKLDENSIGEHTSCTIGKYLEKLKNSNHSDDTVLRIYEPHKKVHELSKKIIHQVNIGNRSDVEYYLRELAKATTELVIELKKDTNVIYN